MKKKSLFVLFSCLVMSWLLLWSADAMTYIVEGTTTRIAIPQSVNWTSINWCYGEDGCEDEILSTSNSNCEIDSNVGFPALVCSHDYGSNPWPHTVIYDGKSRTFENLSLSNWNVTNIVNFWWITKILNIFLDNNTLASFDVSLLSGISPVSIHLENDGLTVFTGNISDRVEFLFLNYNFLTKIPQNVRDRRKNYTIILSPSVKFPSTGSDSKIIDLSNNNINFIKITEIDNKDSTFYENTSYLFSGKTSYNFRWFGYTFSDSNLSSDGNIVYDYKILKDWQEYQQGWTTFTWLHWVDERNGTEAEVEIDTPLMPWDYTFEVCMNMTIVCDSVDFTVSYGDEDLVILKPQSNQIFNDLNFEWERWRRWTFPRSLITWYDYVLKKWVDELLWWFIPLEAAHDCSYTDCVNLSIGDDIRNVLWWGDLSDDYELIVHLVSEDWSYLKTWVRNFKIKIVDDPVIVNIVSPNDEVSTKVVPFERNYTFPSFYYSFSGFEYTLTWPSWFLTGTAGYLVYNTWFELEDLEDGEYSLEVIVHYSDFYWNEKTATGTKNFQMRASEIPYVSILSPISWTAISLTKGESDVSVSFLWDWWATLFNRYHYILSDNSGELTWWDVFVNESHYRQFEYDLWSWVYSFEVNMYKSNSDIPIASDTTEFSVYVPTTLDIISPANESYSSSTLLFSWEWFTPYTLSGYEYTVTWPNWFSTGNSTNGTSFSLSNLYDGEYVFEVTMNYYDGTIFRSVTSSTDFTVNASAWANIEITSPLAITYSWNYTKTVPIEFTWNWWGSPLIARYRYELKNLNTQQLLVSGYVNKNDAWFYSIPDINLSGWEYLFQVTMLDSLDQPLIPAESLRFAVKIPSYLSIIAPMQNVNYNGQQNVNFSRSWFAEFDERYHYEWALKKTKNGNSTTLTWKTDMVNMEITWFQRNLPNGVYDFIVKIMSGNTEIISDSRSFSILDSIDLQLYISDWNTSVTTLNSATWTFVWDWVSEDFSSYYYSITWITFKNTLYVYTWKAYWLSWNLNLSGLSTWKYRFLVNMLNSNSEVITWKYVDFVVAVPATLKIISPVSWSTVNSSNLTFKWDWYSDVITRYEYLLISSWWYNYNWFTTVDSFTRNDLVNWDYTLVVRLASGANFVAEDTIHFTVDIPKKTSWGGWWSSSKSHPTNDLSVSIANESPNTNERIEVKVGVDNKYTWKVDFTKMQYYTGWEWVDIPVTSKNYVSDYWDDAKLWYVKISSSDGWEKELSEFVKLSQKGNYRIYAEDKDWYIDYVQFYVWNWWNNTVRTTTARVDSKPTDTEDEVYIARSCKKYKITYSDSLNVYTSPNLNMSEYFMNKDYFKRYVDSKNRYQNWCPTNVWWISTNYTDKTNDNSRYTAPNGKVYFITWKEWSYYSNELNKELKTPTSFSTIQQLKYYIRDRNPLINMATLWPVK